jgi:hypothetical protein
MVLQSAVELHGALGEALDAFLERGQSVAAFAFGLLFTLGCSEGLSTATTET